MLLSKFKENRIKKKIDKELAVKTGGQTVLSDAKIGSILIFTDKNHIDKLKEVFAEKLEIITSKIEIICFCEVNQEKKSSKLHISKKDFGIFGEIKKQSIKDVVNNEFDLLLNLTKENLLMDILTVTSKAKFKVGFSNADNRLYDLMIDANDISVFSAELKKYLKILNKL